MILLVCMQREWWNGKFHLLAMPIAAVRRVSDVVGGGLPSAHDHHGVTPQGGKALLTKDAVRTACSLTSSAMLSSFLVRQFVAAKSLSPEAPMKSEILLKGPLFLSSREICKENPGRGYRWGHFNVQVSLVIWATVRAMVDDHSKSRKTSMKACDDLHTLDGDPSYLHERRILWNKVYAASECPLNKVFIFL